MRVREFATGAGENAAQLAAIERLRKQIVCPGFQHLGPEFVIRKAIRYHDGTANPCAARMCKNVSPGPVCERCLGQDGRIRMSAQEREGVCEAPGVVNLESVRPDGAGDFIDKLPAGCQIQYTTVHGITLSGGEP
jgi:hypothetical protein